MTMLRAGGLLDVLTPLSDCRHEPQQYRTRFVRDTEQQDIPGSIKERRVQDACYWIRGTVQDTGLKCPWDTEYRMIRTGFIFKRRIESTPGNSYVIVSTLGPKYQNHLDALYS